MSLAETRPPVALAALAAASAVVHAAPAPAAISAAARRVLDLRATTDPRTVALTFDDGPHAQGTPAVLECLAEAGARATFFVVGEQVERYGSIVGEILAAGHEVALHGQTHRSHLRLTPAAAREDLRRGTATVAAATGRAPTLHRPPYGLYSSASLALARRAGLEPLLWTRHGRDWSARATADSIGERLLGGLAGGDVLLLHDADHYGTPGSWRRTADALPRVLDAVAAGGLVAAPA